MNVLFSKKKSQNVYTSPRSERNVKCKKQVNLLMIVDAEEEALYHDQGYIQAFIKIKRENQARISLLHELLQRFSDRVSKRQAL